MNNRVINIILKTIIASIVFCLIISNQYASEASLLTNMTSQADKFVTTGSNNANDITWKNVTNEFVGIGQILTMVGTGVLVAVVAYMGIKYLTAGPEAQAKLKIQLIGVVVSGVVILGAYNIWKIVINIVSKF